MGVIYRQYIPCITSLVRPRGMRSLYHCPIDYFIIVLFMYNRVNSIEDFEITKDQLLDCAVRVETCHLGNKSSNHKGDSHLHREVGHHPIHLHLEFHYD